MLACIAYCHRDIEQAKRLLSFIGHLDPVLPHHCLLVASSQISDTQMRSVYACVPAFSEVATIRQRDVVEGPWPGPSNALFRTACEWVAQNKQFKSFLWLEPDCSPMMSGWLDRLEEEYQRAAKPWMGFVWANPFRHLNGVAVHPSNIAQLNPYMVHASKLPFDCVRPELTLRLAHVTPLINRQLADTFKNEAMTFPTKSSVAVIPKEAVLFHGNRDGTLFSRLMERNGDSFPSQDGKRSLKTVFKRFFGPAKPEPEKRTITIRRTGAIGDALAATCVANKFIEHGHKVVFQCGPMVAKVLKYCSPAIKVTADTGQCDFDLNGVYERIPPAERAKQHFTEIFIDAANKAFRMNMNHWNCAPRMIVPHKITAPFWEKHVDDRLKPWVGIVPKSNSFINRTVPNETWVTASKIIEGTCFWLGTDPAPEGFEWVDVGCRDITEVIAAIGNMDLVISVDSGTAHIAAAMKVPLLVIEQASSPDVHLPECRDWQKISPSNLTCLNCTQLTCPIDADDPPCTHIDPMQIAAAANRRLLANGVSAAIAIYKPSAAMLNQCLIHVLPQVDEIIVCSDQAGKVPEGALTHPKIKYIRSRLNDSGYARKLLTAFRHTVNPFVLALNPDAFLDADAVHYLLETMKADSKCGLVGHTLYFPGRKKLQHGGPFRRAGKGDLGWGHLNDMPPKITEVTEVPFVTGASCLIRRSAFYDVDGISDLYRLYYEDCDFCLSIRKAGWKIYMEPRAVGIHDEHSETNPRLTPDVAEQVRISKEIFASRWLDYFEHNDAAFLGNFDYLKR